ncbi:MAG: hypothetical protein J6U97_05700 [Bacteroidaceae bacterium]|nr:hypothetical protein [Bacteroidaceae bacterium]
MNKMKRFGLIALSVAIAIPTMAKKEIPLVYDVEFTGAEYEAPYFPTLEEAPVVKTLPNPFEFSNSTKQVKKFKDWEKRRAEIIRELEHYELGTKPLTSKENIKAKMEGNKLTVDITVNGNTLTIVANIKYPEGDGPFPAIIGMGGGGTGSLPAKIFDDRKIAQISWQFGQVMSHTQKRGNEPFNKIYPELVDNGSYSVWPWGLSRIIDGLEIVGTEVSKIDLKHIAVSGCSYAGKMALYCGALDERIALTIAQEPGGGGVDAWRVSETLGNVETLGNTNHSWFMESMFQYAGENVNRLPMDHHELAALVCPRALLVLGNTDYEWMAEESNSVSSAAARKVWEKFGIEDRMGYSIQGGHMHCALPQSQYPEVEAFVDKFLLGKEANTIVTYVDETLKDVDYKKWMPWAE